MRNEKSFYHLNLQEAEGLSAVKKQVLFSLADIRVRGGGVLCIHHGENADNASAKQKKEIRRLLLQQKKKGMILVYIAGADFKSDDAATGYLLDKMPSLLESTSLNTGDDSITLAYLNATDDV